MAAFYLIPDRRVVPNWRSYKTTVILGELDSTLNVKNQFHVDISKQIRDWELSSTIGTAADLLGAVYLSTEKDNNRIVEASNYILNNKDKASEPLIVLANELINPKKNSSANPLDELEIKDLLEINFASSKKKIIDTIRSLKANIGLNPFNSIYWVEISRLYSILGQEKQATNAMQIAVNLSPDNRFVLRASTRLFIHYNEPDKALHYLRKSPATKIDPWLLSAHIATTSILNKHQINANIGRDMVVSKKFSDFNITELSSSIGTLEFSSGTIKSSKKYFDISIKAPNDNSLAQLEWISQKDRRFMFGNVGSIPVSNSYEAFAIEYFEKGKWVESVKHSIKWFYDMPYSSEPVVLGSFIFSAFLDDQEAAIKLCELGLISNPYDISIINNLIYAFLLANKVDLAQSLYESLNLSDVRKNHESVIMLQATAGLLCFRQGYIEDGKQLYELSIKNAKAINRRDLELLANINYLRELILNNCPEFEGVFYQLSTINDKDIKLYVIELKRSVVKLYHAKKKL